LNHKHTSRPLGSKVVAEVGGEEEGDDAPSSGDDDDVFYLFLKQKIGKFTGARSNSTIVVVVFYLILTTRPLVGVYTGV